MAVSIFHRRLRFADTSNPIERLHGLAFNEALAKTFQKVIAPGEESVSSEREIEIRWLAVIRPAVRESIADGRPAKGCWVSPQLTGRFGPSSCQTRILECLESANP